MQFSGQRQQRLSLNDELCCRTNFGEMRAGGLLTVRGYGQSANYYKNDQHVYAIR